VGGDNACDQAQRNQKFCHLRLLKPGRVATACCLFGIDLSLSTPMIRSGTVRGNVHDIG
jgi:hypothetical protein